ncbi:hypothetical protein BT69DRAFT_1279332 [Atractiella rhizophila]|nr:hypothetical protein BT69DRAFT_1279332 [Atractiella rhizophila]
MEDPDIPLRTTSQEPRPQSSSGSLSSGPLAVELVNPSSKSKLETPQHFYRPPAPPGTGTTGHSYSPSQASYISPFGTKPVGKIGVHKPREIIRVERDYSVGSEGCQFWSGWLSELEGRITPTEFQNTLNEMNSILASAHAPSKSIFDNLLAIFTFYLSPLMISTHYQREMRKFDQTIKDANRETFNPAGLNILHPRKNAFLFLEIEYY